VTPSPYHPQHNHQRQAAAQMAADGKAQDSSVCRAEEGKTLCMHANQPKPTSVQQRSHCCCIAGAPTAPCPLRNAARKATRPLVPRQPHLHGTNHSSLQPATATACTPGHLCDQRHPIIAGWFSSLHAQKATQAWLPLLASLPLDSSCCLLIHQPAGRTPAPNAPRET
jgi:hypothetical protein